MKYFFKVLPVLFFWGSFIFVVLKIPYPETLTQANIMQVLSFFASLYLALVFTLNIVLRNILSSSAISLGLIFLLVLQALDSLNIVTGILTIVAIALLFGYFRKAKGRSLTKQTKIPKLTSLRRNKH